MDFMIVIALLAGLAAGIVIGCYIGGLRGKQALAGAVGLKEFNAAVQEKTLLEGRLESLNAERQAQKADMEGLNRELIEARERVVRADAKARELDQRLREQQEELAKMKEQMKIEFKNTATGILEEMSTKFNAQSEKQVGDLLTPMREKLTEFQKLVGESFSKQGQEQHTLRSEIEKIVLQTDGLAKALRGDVKAQGNWGEVMLERILEESGLRKDEDYILQGTDMGLSGADGARQRPDVIVKLPDNKHIIIDAKVSLTAYDRFCAETEEAQRDLHLRDYLKSVKAHVNGLEERRYQDNGKMNTPDFVLMFMPIEGAYSLAVQQDRELHSYAWGKRIVIVCPATLFATLRTIASLWNIERQNRYTQEIVAEAGAFYDKLVGFMTDMNKIGDRIGALQGGYEEAFNKLSKGRGNLVSRAEKLKDYGVKTSKSLLKVVRHEEDAPAEIAVVANEA